MKDLSEEKWNVFPPLALWVMPRRWYTTQVDPDSSSEEETDADLPSTSGALAAAALAGAHEDEEHPVHVTAQAQEEARSAAPGTQVTAAETWAVTLHGPRARGPALLRSLRRGSRAVLSRVAAVTRRHSQQPGTQQHLHQGTGAVTVAAPAAGAQSWAAAPHGPGCPPSPSPGLLEAVGGQGAGPAVGTLLATPEPQEKSWFSLEEDLEVEILQELPQEDEDPEEGWPQVSTSKTLLGHWLPCSPASQVEARRQRATAAERILLPGMVDEEGDTSEDVQAGSSRVQSAAKGEDRSMKDLSEEKWNVFPPLALWVTPRRWYTTQVDPDSSSEEETDADLPSTSGALAAAALAGAHEDEEHPVHATAQAQEEASGQTLLKSLALVSDHLATQCC
ncbi:hypothetical protein HGM15179_000230 [Zosterops borbonicus]|uniref:Uncharacterized protein n=1 Tax=Zosterops borbonicus TaxID=364589 RepID=A0A8K1GX92_9PASS|nr:hypothetical protein HGM15179_000230 [Zosterops borbonicus]